MRYTDKEYREIKDCIAISDVRNYSVKESMAYIEQQTGIKVKYETLLKIRIRLKKETEIRFKKLVRSRYDYQHEIMKSLQEKENLISKSWEIFETVASRKEQILCLKVINEIQNDKYRIIKEMPDTVVSSGASEEAEDYDDFINSTRPTGEESKNNSEESPVF
ncbi:MAG TPA: hypothetical protein VE643_09020 [Nitrososphaeraceae archaeon]|nr:hypothetical protein [Nitrososphaeraceae archaeon]